MNNWLWILFSVGLFVLIADAVVPFAITERIARQRVTMDRIEHSVDQLKSLISAYKDAETGQRGFALSGRQESLEPYIDGRRNIEMLLPQIGKAVAADFDQAGYATLLELDRNESAYQREQIAATRAGRATNAADFERGKSRMDAIRDTVSAVIDKADVQASAARATAAKFETLGRWLIVSVTILDVLLFSVTFWFATQLLRLERHASHAAERAHAASLGEGALREAAMRKLEAHAHRRDQIIETQTALAHATSRPEDFLALVVDRILTLTPASGAAVEMVEANEWVCRATSGVARHFLGARLARGSTLSDICFAQHKVMIAADTGADPRVDHTAAIAMGAAALVVAPLLRSGEVVGVLKIFSAESRAFDESDVQTVRLLARLLGTALGDRLAVETNAALLEERSSALAALGQHQRLLRAVTDDIPALVAFVGLDEHYRYWNKHYYQTFGREPAGQSVCEFMGEETYALLKPHIDEALSGAAVNFESRLATADGSRHTQVHFIPQFDELGCAVGFCVMAWDIHARKEREMNWQSRALVDQLTGTRNHFSFVDALEQAVARLGDEGKLAVFYLDIDHFKAVNDTHGHATGDAVLRGFAAAVKAALRTADVLGRLGGDEFCVLAENVSSLESARRIADKILEHVRTIDDAGSALPRITTSIGIAFIDGACASAEELIQLADAALYEAKQAGRNCYAERAIGAAAAGEGSTTGF